MKYIVLEIQAGEQIGLLTNTYEDKNEALSKFHTILASAALSEVPCHTAMIITEDGLPFRTECIKHEVEA
jgi:hypothetical protein